MLEVYLTVVSKPLNTPGEGGGGEGGGGWLSYKSHQKIRIEHLRGTNLGVAQPRPQDSPMFYEKKKPTDKIVSDP